MTLTPLLLFVAALLPLTASAQITVDTARGLVGEEVRLAVRTVADIDATAIDSTGALMMRGSIHLSNPTVFYPERFTSSVGASIRRYELRKLTDSTYVFEVVISFPARRVASGDTLFMLAGEALAGYDSVAVVRFDGVRATDGLSYDATGIVITRSIGTPMPYVRYATLEQGYPNPASRFQTVTWAFRLDKQSQVSFGIYNLHGELISDRDLGRLGPGIHIETFTIGFDVAGGTYVVHLRTETGNAWTWMTVVK